MQGTGAIIGIGRTVFSLMTILQSSHAWDTLPFISPLLWFDWVTIYRLLDYYLPKLAVIPAIIGACLYFVCFWLTIGYGSLGYGVRQYNVLNIPMQCQTYGAFQTDPRRDHFVGLHVAMFAMGTAGLCGGMFLKIERQKLGKSGGQYVQAAVACAILLPSVVGAIVAGVVNGHSYLLLNRNGCFASYVSGRFGYIDVDLIEWKIKLATWLGVNV